MLNHRAIFWRVFDSCAIKIPIAAQYFISTKPVNLPVCQFEFYIAGPDPDYFFRIGHSFEDEFVPMQDFRRSVCALRLAQPRVEADRQPVPASMKHKLSAPNHSAPNSLLGRDCPA
jgi:hypothetical protein